MNRRIRISNIRTLFQFFGLNINTFTGKLVKRQNQTKDFQFTLKAFQIIHLQRHLWKILK